MTVQTARLLLIPATADLIDCELHRPSEFKQALQAEIPENWPPQELADALPWFLKQLQADSELAGWLTWYALLRDQEGPASTLIGSCGFFGRPVEGTTEVGYSILPQFQRQGYATEMVEGLITWARTQPGVTRFVAETSPDNRASFRVLEKLGFSPAGAGREENTLRFEKVTSL